MNILMFSICFYCNNVFVFRNCFTFNQKDSEIYKHAKKMEEKLDALLEVHSEHEQA